MPISQDSEKNLRYHEYLNFVKIDLKIFKIYLIFVIPWIICYYFFYFTGLSNNENLSTTLKTLKYINDLFFLTLSTILITFPIYFISFTFIYGIKFQNYSKFKVLLLFLLSPIFGSITPYIALLATVNESTGYKNASNMLWFITFALLVLSFLFFITSLIKYYTSSYKTLKTLLK